MNPEDRDHLRLLSIFHYVVAALAALFSCIFLVHFGLGATMAFDATAFGPDPPPPFVGVLLMVFGGAAVLVGWSYAVCVALAGRSLARGERYSFCLVMAAISCALMPFGTVLGVFTLLVLLRPSVKPLFGVGGASAPAPPAEVTPA